MTIGGYAHVKAFDVSIKHKDFCKTSVDLEFGVAGVTGTGKERVKRLETSRSGQSETVGLEVLG
ncbi:MAG: hypothetical protein Q8O57_06625, partial [Kiritimatiellota bacterium]|nr:hypothetical protein [Kiritimatiellota bacterium]